MDGFANVLCVSACEVRENLTVTRVEHRNRFALAAFDALVVNEVSGHGHWKWRSMVNFGSRDNQSECALSVIEEKNRG